jgi:L,D-peptidoglycan transpeptidase YkuD (ErfK/YbiS/YcfS/YnhG family)
MVGRIAFAASLVAAAPFRVPPSTRQLVVVVTDGWQATRGRLERWRRGVHGWQRVGAPVDAALGRDGLGWGRGLHPDGAADEPHKREGDGRAPAGVFRLVEATGYAAAPPAGATLRYRRADARLRCVDDPASPDYNRLVDAAPAGEPMWRDDALYAWTIVVEHNRAPVAPGAGSCIFVHAGGATAPTAGCTAVDATALTELLAWLDAAARPLLVQLPEGVYRRVQMGWGLPRR